ncbi:hypothetical protein QNI19_03460 [Cytophagaceae bacterium DM2B3-1]|uniref:Uncharacterized protein n=1 Tax=Xanthocytophaga flava TaxID=3048013 RepID=A0ABT7CG53_9BACT|nr:hypothetical protein [Xanthocytophaga flavus]MDJ1473128.1 hypothetical protein [Xanthocytophaga flavus]MDJ1491975.1 hypothetical protein [Xanthocytophaga flavus]
MGISISIDADLNGYAIRECGSNLQLSTYWLVVTRNYRDYEDSLFQQLQDLLKINLKPFSYHLMYSEIAEMEEDDDFDNDKAHAEEINYRKEQKVYIKKCMQNPEKVLKIAERFQKKIIHNPDFIKSIDWEFVIEKDDKDVYLDYLTGDQFRLDIANIMESLQCYCDNGVGKVFFRIST